MNQLNLTPCNDMAVENAYIITIKDNPVSEMLSKRCQQSCDEVGMPYTVWQAFDGTSGTIQVPDNLKDASWLKWFKLYETFLSPTEVSCYLSHLSLWVHCMEIDKPIVIFEHDAVMVKPYRNHFGFNQIVYLGCNEQANGWNVTPIPPLGQRNPHYKFMLRAHAYAVDPHSAKNLVAHTLKHGINESLDVTIRADLFGIIQGGLFAFDIPYHESTINSRLKHRDGTER